MEYSPSLCALPTNDNLFRKLNVGLGARQESKKAAI
jgi:hypothetical protein